MKNPEVIALADDRALERQRLPTSSSRRGATEATHPPAGATSLEVAYADKKVKSSKQGKYTGAGPRNSGECYRLRLSAGRLVMY